jgi:hypothetical protein
MQALEYQKLPELPLHSIIKRKKQNDYDKKGVLYTGIPRKHPYDPNRLLLIAGILEGKQEMYEFLLEDILHVEEREQLTDPGGGSFEVVDVWVQKGSLAFLLHPFSVGK